MLLEGLKLTIGISLLAIAAGMVIGFLSCIMGLSKNPVLKAISAVYVWLIRGTPMIVQAFFVFFAVPQVIQLITKGPFTLTPFTAGAITLSLNAGAYLSEIFRSGTPFSSASAAPLRASNQRKQPPHVRPGIASAAAAATAATRRFIKHPPR